jgi:hypothetical protein
MHLYAPSNHVQNLRNEFIHISKGAYFLVARKKYAFALKSGP